jgi:lipoyl(octanoyl) transferase
VTQLAVKQLERADYIPTWEAMKAFTASRGPDTPDELWLVEHPPVYTLGQAGKPEHLLWATDIPAVNIDRGGQVTYHGPGQIVAYLMLDLRRRGLGVKELVSRMEQAVIDLLADYGVAAERREKAPGVYVNGAKIAALGLRIKNGCCYHGLALNVDMDLTPYQAINPCGYAGLAVTQTCDQGIEDGVDVLGRKLIDRLTERLGDSPSSPALLPEGEGSVSPSPFGRGGGGEGPPSKHKLPLPEALKDFARHLRAEQTDAETLLWSLLRDRRLLDLKFRRQHPVPPYVLDFYCHDLNLAVELDGGQHTPEIDAERTAYLEQKGIRLLRYWNHDLLQNTEDVLTDLYNHCTQHPSPSGRRVGDEGPTPPEAPNSRTIP